MYWNLRDAVKAHPYLDDIFSGASWMQPASQKSKRPLYAPALFQMLSCCQVISSKNTSLCLDGRRSKATVGRYTGAARVASLFIRRELEKAEARLFADAPLTSPSV